LGASSLMRNMRGSPDLKCGSKEDTFSGTCAPAPLTEAQLILKQLRGARDPHLPQRMALLAACQKTPDENPRVYRDWSQ
jgi:hypothetical protein